MRRFPGLYVLAFLLAACGAADAQVVLPGGPDATVCVYNSTLPTLAAGQKGYLQCDSSGRLAIGSSAPSTAPTTNNSGSISAANTYQQALAANPSRKGCTVFNPPSSNEYLLVYFGSDAPGAVGSSNGPYQLQPGQSISCWNGAYILSDTIQLAAASVGHPYVVTAQ